METGNGWQSLGTSDVGVADDEERLLDSIQETSPGRYHGRVRVLPAHPFFFEHPLDHLPGTYLLEVGRQLALASARRYGRCGVRVKRASRFAVRFAGFAEKRDLIEVTADLSSTRGELAVSFRGSQSKDGAPGKELGSASSVWRFQDDEPAAKLARGPALPREAERVRVARELVHKTREENVLLDWVARDEALERSFVAEMRLVPDHPFFRPRAEGAYGGLYMVEASRQLGEAVSHAFFGAPRDRAFVIESMDVSLPGVGALGERVILGARCLELQAKDGVPRRMRFSFEARQGERLLLSAEAVWLVLPASIYRRIRGAA